MVLKRCFGVCCGNEGLVGADVVFKLRRLSRARDGAEALDILNTSDRLDDPAVVDKALSRLHQLGAERVLLPSLELQARLTPSAPVPLVDIGDALRDHLERRAGHSRRLGVLALAPELADYLAQCLDPERWTLLFPPATASFEALLNADDAVLNAAAIATLAQVCQALRAQGAEVIVPGHAAFSLAVDALAEHGQPVLDLNLVYARYALELGAAARCQPRKIGVVGGVGPAATVDFTDKIVRNTPARCDQDHVKVVVEMNPQIPDRTAHLVGNGRDPTGEIYATCRQLELDAADFIAIPCNTAHAFVGRIQPCLSIPIVSMPEETVDYIRRHFSGCHRVGVLATSGTLASRIYHDCIERAGLQLLVPDEAHQALVMRAIYGERGVKAGFTSGICRDDLMQALLHLVGRGAEVVLLACTELPLIQAMNEDYLVGGRRIALLEPTSILARRCVALAQA